ncbi:hypothetical protein AVEN_119948-1 [Araneus ventricosus]|uniref:Uncharacterized protein n=1 Tax=Araneus ventricosus TaxID=182803 RepID=A0A4Y2QD84_ARAVE|nr:hypothetical protein AVEN_17201-1 [Araneus ventricosus]GBN61202.1 hypothetical protein AVEN_119948-1 [Araneus ventricosus]
MVQSRRIPATQTPLHKPPTLLSFISFLASTIGVTHGKRLLSWATLLPLGPERDANVGISFDVTLSSHRGLKLESRIEFWILKVFESHHFESFAPNLTGFRP